MLPRLRPAEPPFSTRWAALIAVGAGLLGLLAFPRFGVWPLAFASVASFSVVVHGRRARQAAWLGLIYGAAFFGPLLHWTGVYVGAAPWLILAAAEAGYFAGMGAVLSMVQRLPFAPLWVGVTWVLEEAIRDRAPFGGFPWGRLAFSQAESPLRWLAALGGAPLVSFAVALGGGGLAVVLLNVRERRWRPLAFGAAVLAAVPVASLLLGVVLRPGPDSHSRTTTIAVVQGSVPDRGLESMDRRRQVLDNHVTQTLKLAAEIKAGTEPQPSLVVWPENSSDLDPYNNADAASEITRAVRAVGVPILVGAILDGPGPKHDRNVGILWSPTTGPGDTYTKRHPVPFAEYMPLRSLATAISEKANLVERDMVAGSGNGLLEGGPFPIGDVICFEVAYDSLVRSSVEAGAQFLVIQTNNATFGHTGEAYQQLAMSQLRAVEHGRAVAMVSTTGVSALIGPDGQIRQRTGALFEPGILVGEMPLRTATTLATRLGAIPEYVLTAVALLALGWSIWVARAARREGERGIEDDDASDAEEMVIA
ncbi:MAG TPA: apolipoprotein N-acyltransferase [Jatrophihabitantaceae bacterium]|nr:apolipoprotein N-acyltransferase [Jatrophihabitantaceae bacterium]